MTRPAREPVAIFGMVSALLVASVAPLAVPVLWAPGAVSGGPSAGTSSPASTGTPTAGGSETTDPPTGAAGTTAPSPGEAGRPSVNSATPPPAEPAVDCSGTGTPSLGSRGAGVAVAVVDPSGFDVDDPAIADRVAASASFAAGERLDIRNDGRDDHGTAAARVVARQAPGASLYLANFRTAYDFRQAVRWAIDQDVDVLVAPTVFHAKPDDGTAPVSRAVAEAAAAGVTVVVPTGNAARNHWEGGYDGNGTVAFDSSATRLYLDSGGERVGAWLWWNRSEDVDENAFSVVLYRETDDGPRRVATSEDYPVGPVGTNQVLTESVRTNDLLTSEVGNGTFFLRIEGPVGEPHRVELVVTTHRIGHPTTAGSIAAPATAEEPGVVAVGAVNPDTGEVLASSGRGPTNDGRVGVDVLARPSPPGAGRFTGTSMAAAYTGGLASTLVGANPALSPADVEGVLAATARGDERTMAAGWGRVDPDAARACARSR